eukprot:4425113-Pyramimonas_sp.AAC.2
MWCVTRCVTRCVTWRVISSLSTYATRSVCVCAVELQRCSLGLIGQLIRHTLTLMCTCPSLRLVNIPPWRPLLGLTWLPCQRYFYTPLLCVTISSGRPNCARLAPGGLDLLVRISAHLASFPPPQASSPAPRSVSRGKQKQIQRNEHRTCKEAERKVTTLLAGV